MYFRVCFSYISTFYIKTTFIKTTFGQNPISPFSRRMLGIKQNEGRPNSDLACKVLYREVVLAVDDLSSGILLYFNTFNIRRLSASRRLLPNIIIREFCFHHMKYPDWPGNIHLRVFVICIWAAPWENDSDQSTHLTKYLHLFKLKVHIRNAILIKRLEYVS